MDKFLEDLTNEIEKAHTGCQTASQSIKDLKKLLLNKGFKKVECNKNNPSRFDYVFMTKYEKLHQDKPLQVHIERADAYPSAKYNSDLELTITYDGKELYCRTVEVPFPKR